MFRIWRLGAVALLSVVMAGACGSDQNQARTFEGETFSFAIPAGWQTMEEVWGDRAAVEQDYKGLGVQELVSLQYPPEPGKGEAFLTVASSALADGQDLESRYTEAYEAVVPEIEDVSRQVFEQGDLSGYQISYKRPWGEPWWRFRDIWLERDGVVYVLSFQAPPNSFEVYSDIFGQILGGFRFKV